jgi:2-polyprenyl-6-methoxyphenol hydroxylase-like FAD-dependent oxidoreductase
MKVAIAGAGIGGLTAALSLERAGIDVTVFESVAEVQPLGVGINILPHASREFIDLGLEEEIDRFAIRTTAMNYYTRSGMLAISQPCGMHAGYHWPQWSLHRGHLQMALLDAFKRRAGAHRIVTDAELVAFRQGRDGVLVNFRRPREGGTFGVNCDVLVGADGLHSAVRAGLYPEEGRPIYAGLVLYRGAVDAPTYLDGQTMIIVGDKRLRLVSYPISHAAQEAGEQRSLINWIAVMPVPEAEAPGEDWTKRYEQHEVQARYADWRFDWLDVPGMLAATEPVFEFPVYDRDPLERWSFDHVTLLGDAAHPLIPVSSSGAVQAIIDGRALAYALATHGDPVTALQAYQADRLPKANGVVLASRRNGPDEVLEIVAARCPDGATNIHDFVPREELQAVIDDFKHAAGFNVETLNSQPSYTVPR